MATTLPQRFHGELGVLQLIFMDELTDAMRSLQEQMRTGGGVSPVGKIVSTSLIVPPIPQYGVTVHETLRETVVAPKETLSGLEIYLQETRGAIVKLGDELSGIRKMWTHQGQIISGKDVAITEDIIIIASFPKPTISSFWIVNKGDKAVFAGMNDSTPGHSVSPGDSFSVDYQTKSISKIQLKCGDDEDTTVDYLATY